MTQSTRKNIVNIPLGLIPLVFENKAVNQFRVFIAIKLVSPGHVKNSKEDLTKLCEATGFLKRTVQKHLSSLVSLGWLGHDSINQTYYDRSWASFRTSGIFFNRLSIPVSLDDLKSFQPLLVAAMLTQRINAQEHHHNNLFKESGRKPNHFRKPRKTAAIIRGAVSQVQTVSAEVQKIGFDYFGLSNKSIAKMLNLSQTRACEIKSEAVANKYICTKKHFNLIAEYDHPIPDMRNNFQCGLRNGHNNIRINTQKRKGVTYYQLLEQLHDEIIPLIHLKRVNYQKLAKQKHIRSITPFNDKQAA